MYEGRNLISYLPHAQWYQQLCLKVHPFPSDPYCQTCQIKLPFMHESVYGWLGSLLKLHLWIYYSLQRTNVICCFDFHIVYVSSISFISAYSFVLFSLDLIYSYFLTSSDWWLDNWFSGILHFIIFILAINFLWTLNAFPKFLYIIFSGLS